MKGILVIVLITLAIIVVLLTTKDSDTGETYPDRLIRALTEKEKLDLDTRVSAIKRAVVSYSLDHDKYPETLDELVPNYLRLQDNIQDPWGEVFELGTDEENQLILISSGKDHVMGNDDDIKRRLQ
jgi:hypothetical protein